MLEKQLAEIAEIPSRLDKLIDRIERSNSTLANQVNSTMMRTAKELTTISSKRETSSYAVQHSMPEWMKWTIVISVIFIAMACISNSVYNIWFSSNTTTNNVTSFEVTDVNDTTEVMFESADTMRIPPKEDQPQQPSPNYQNRNSTIQ